MTINAASLANIPITDFPNQLKQLYEGGCRWFHVDLMDGHYVPNLMFPLASIGQIKALYPDCTMEVHLMVTNPEDYIAPLAAAGCNMLSFHIDATSFSRRLLTNIKDHGMKAGIALNPSQRIDILEPFADLLDHIVFMSVEPGFAGQTFLPGSLERLRQLSLFRKKNGLSFQIVVDGGAHYGILRDLIENGCDAVVTNIYTIFNQPDGIISSCKRFETTVQNLHSLI